jgi:perosamine synthetase
MSNQIPLSAPDITQREIDAVVDVLRTPTLTCGPVQEEFEHACARIAGRRHGIAVSSGTAALHCIAAAAELSPGDEVITTPMSFVASTNCILYTGARPVFVDINPQTLNLDPNRLEAAITPRTRAIVVVEAFGHPGGIEEIERIAQRHELLLIEDSCEGLGARTKGRPLGSFGWASCFSFYPNKQVTAGEGGMVVTDDDRLATACRMLRNHGRDGNAWLAHQRLGYNYRMSEMNAALGLAQLTRLDEILAKRRQAAHRYFEQLIDSHYLILPTIDGDTVMSWYVFVIRLNDLFEDGDRDEVIRLLRAEGIGCSNYFPPIHLQPYIMEQLGTRKGDLPICERIAERTLVLPFFTQITGNQIQRVCGMLDKAIEKVLMGRSAGRA